MPGKPYSAPVLRRLKVATCSRKGRRRVHLGKGHPWATASGQQWAYRVTMALYLGRRLDTAEHVDHIDRDRLNDSPENLRVLLAEGNHHYRRHVFGIVAEWVEGVLVEYPEPLPVDDVPF